MKRSRNPEPNGFSLVEVIIAMLILTLGILAMASSTGYVFTRIRDSGRGTERVIARQQVIERLRALPYDSIKTRDESAADRIGAFKLWWAVEAPLATNMKKITVFSEGPGHVSGKGWQSAVRDTFVITAFEP